MQAEELSKQSYDTLGRFEKGRSKGKLTRTDSLSWKDKSWVIGIQIVIHDEFLNTPLVIALSGDGQSFAAFQRNSNDEIFIIRNDSLVSDKNKYDFAGRNSNGSKIRSIKAYQEFWHSWKTFHPDTGVYKTNP